MKIKIILAILGCLILAAVVILPTSNETSYEVVPRETKLLFVGDMMFDRTIRSIAEKKGYDSLFSCIDGYLKGFDLVIGNLEGPITEMASVSQNTKPGEPGNTSFTFDIKTAELLSKNNIKMVNLGNNHALDLGAYGMERTKEELRKEGVIYFGAPGDDIVATTTVAGYNIAIINFNQFLGQSSSQKVIETIWKMKREADLVVVYTHWGDEYVPATDFQKALAHGFIDAGADIVIGSHPHVIQEKEIYNGKTIYYSLGNFIFDQYWNKEVSTGAGVEVTIKGNSLEQKEVFFDIRRSGETCLSDPS